MTGLGRTDRRRRRSRLARLLAGFPPLALALLLLGPWPVSPTVSPPAPRAGGTTVGWVPAGATNLTFSPGVLSSWTYDAADGYYLFYGRAGGAWTNETWILDGHGWINLTANETSAPPSRISAATAYDPGLGEVLLFGGAFVGSVGYWNDTWAFRGGNWTRLSPTTVPTIADPIAAPEMVYDPDLGTVLLILVGENGTIGTGGAPSPENTSSWSFQGGSWRLLGTGPAPVNQSAGDLMVYDSAVHAALLLNSAGELTGGFSTWADVNGTWSTPATLQAGRSRVFSQAAYDPSQQEVIALSLPYLVLANLSLVFPTFALAATGWVNLTATAGPISGLGLPVGLTLNATSGTLALLGTQFGSVSNASAIWSFEAGRWSGPASYPVWVVTSTTPPSGGGHPPANSDHNSTGAAFELVGWILLGFFAVVALAILLAVIIVLRRGGPRWWWPFTAPVAGRPASSHHKGGVYAGSVHADERHRGLRPRQELR